MDWESSTTTRVAKAARERAKWVSVWIMDRKWLRTANNSGLQMAPAGPAGTQGKCGISNTYMQCPYNGLVPFTAAGVAAPGAPPLGYPLLLVGGQQLRGYVHNGMQRTVLAMPGQDVAFVRDRIQDTQLLTMRPSYINAVLIQSRGTLVPGGCNECRRRGFTPFPTCVRLAGHWNSACGNCKWRDHGARCRVIVEVPSDSSSDDPDNEGDEHGESDSDEAPVKSESVGEVTAFNAARFLKDDLHKQHWTHALHVIPGVTCNPRASPRDITFCLAPAKPPSQEESKRPKKARSAKVQEATGSDEDSTDDETSGKE
ncbi:hypothetical protein ACMFMG_007587 [Clarireedia jacksonii]